MSKKKITLKEIAAMANVNASTVSRAFSAQKRELISKEVRERILAIAEKYEYEPKSAARSLAQGKSFQLGIILHNLEADLSSHNLSIFLSEFCREAIRNNYQTMLLPIEGGEFDMETVKTIRSSRADAYFIGAPLMGMRTMDELAKRKIPVATYISDNDVCGSLTNITCVHTVDKPAFTNMFKTIKQRGFESMAVAGFSKMADHPRLNLDHYVEKYGLKIDETILFDLPFYSAMTLRESFLMAQKMIERIAQHKLIFCSSDFVALGICDALRQAGIEPGKDISVIGYDNVEGHKSTSSEGQPFLATIEKNDRIAAKSMVNNLLQRINTPEDNKKRGVINIPTEFIPRDSLGWNNNRGIN